MEFVRNKAGREELRTDADRGAAKLGEARLKSERAVLQEETEPRYQRRTDAHAVCEARHGNQKRDNFDIDKSEMRDSGDTRVGAGPGVGVSRMAVFTPPELTLLGAADPVPEQRTGFHHPGLAFPARLHPSIKPKQTSVLLTKPSCRLTNTGTEASARCGEEPPLLFPQRQGQPYTHCTHLQNWTCDSFHYPIRANELNTLQTPIPAEMRVAEQLLRLGTFDTRSCRHGKRDLGEGRMEPLRDLRINSALAYQPLWVNIGGTGQINDVAGDLSRAVGGRYPPCENGRYKLSAIRLPPGHRRALAPALTAPSSSLPSSLYYCTGPTSQALPRKTAQHRLRWQGNPLATTDSTVFHHHWVEPRQLQSSVVALTLSGFSVSCGKKWQSAFCHLNANSAGTSLKPSLLADYSGHLSVPQLNCASSCATVTLSPTLEADWIFLAREDSK
ncbi:hypothetical protein Bbelb_380840 [Branchiostoma belcheri]|nr:hypothetical protein Bbelb_380840 [Branchiostoma belcheri]